VMLTSRADSARSRMVSCALAVLHDDWRHRRGLPATARAEPDPTDAPGVADR